MKYAYVTVLSTNNYYDGVSVLYESLKRTNPKYEFVVVVNETIDEEIIQKLISKGCKIIKRPRIVATNIKNTLYPQWNNTFDKFNIFDLTEFDKIVYLDSDMLILRNIDELFDLPNLSATIAGKLYYTDWTDINSGMMVIEPKKGILEGLKEILYSEKFKVGFGDQNIIEAYFDWHNKNLEISEKYNMFLFLIDYYFNHFDFNRDMLCIVHYIGLKKPWLMTEEEKNEYRERVTKENKPNALYYFEKYLELLEEVKEK
jgi:alpha-N-acetylglucosamine transferase